MPFIPLVAVAAIALGQALQLYGVLGRPLPILLVTATLVACLLAILRPAALAHCRGRPTTVILGAAVLCQLLELALAPRGLHLDVGRWGLLPVAAVVLGAALVVVAEIAGVPRFARLRLPLLVVAYAALGGWLLQHTADPGIDVYTFHVEAFRALGHGVNPYAITMPNIYSDTQFYGPGLVRDGRLTFGFVYPPLSLLLAGVGHVLAGDYRYANVAAIGVSALLIGTCRPGAVLPAALFLFTPRTLLVIKEGWTEPYVVLCFAAIVWCACRARRLLPVALGSFFAVKQYGVLAAPLVPLLYPGPWRASLRVVATAAVVAAVITLPFVVAGPAAFMHSVVATQLHQPFRADALSYPAVWLRLTGQRAPTWPAFVLAPLALGFGLRWAPRTPAGFALAAALAFGVFFAFNKQAFVNYYFFVIAALCCALAAGGLETEPAGTPV